MPNTFKRSTSRNIGTTITQIGSYVAPAATQTTVIGLVVCNTTLSAITVDVQHFDGTNGTYIIKGATIAPGGAEIVVGGDQKIVLQTGDSMRVQSSAASSVDAIMSMLEIT